MAGPMPGTIPGPMPGPMHERACDFFKKISYISTVELENICTLLHLISNNLSDFYPNQQFAKSVQFLYISPVREM